MFLKKPSLRRTCARVLTLGCAIGALSAGAATAAAPSASSPAAATKSASSRAAAKGSIKPQLFDLAFNAATCAVRMGSVNNPSTLTVIDYSQPSTARRLWVYDVKTKQLLYSELVAHGEGSGDNFARQFSNTPETHKSSIGLFVTEDTYVGKNGYSLRLNGLDVGFNHLARERAIVMHGAPYVSEAFADEHGRLGRSWGCPAVSTDIAQELIDRIKGGNLVFAYYPDQGWLRASKYLGGCESGS